MLLAVSLRTVALKIVSRKSSRKRELGKWRVGRLTELANALGYKVHVYSKIHMRVFGETVIDYWPTSGKCWKTGSSEKSQPMTPEQAIVLAQSLTLEDEADKHMASIAVEDQEGPPPWE